MKKKLISGVLALSMLCGTAFMAACGESKKSSSATQNNQQQQTPSNGNPVTPPEDTRPVDTYTGYLSEDIYATEYDALSSYVANELKGAATIGDIYNYEIGEELSADEISALNIGEVENLFAVRKMRVQYVDKDTDDIKEKDLYLVTLEDGYYKYFAPALNTGEPLVKSYYDSVASNTLSNTSVTCTINATQKLALYDTGDSVPEYTTSTTSSVWKFTADVAHCKSTITAEDGSRSETEMYVARSQNNPETFMAYMYIESYGWYTMPYPISYNLESIKKTDPNYLMAVTAMIEFATADQTYFEKTDFGFRMSADKMQQYTDQIMIPLLDDVFKELLGSSYSLAEMNLTYHEDTFVNYYLKNGMLNKYDYRNKCTCVYPNLGMTLDMDITGTLTYSNYNATVINVSEDLKELFNQY